MDTVALRVNDAIFHATHFPSPIQKLNPKTGETANYSEAELLLDFLDKRLDHLFCVTVGDSGTGKSHLIRWIYQQIEHQKQKSTISPHIVLVPRHCSNLADVLKHILQDFHGEEIDRIQQEIKRTANLTLVGAMECVLDALAFVLNPENRERTNLSFPDDEEHKDIICPLLPAMLRDQSIRDELTRNAKDGIVGRLAGHVMGTRQQRATSIQALKWTAEDLKFAAKITKLAGADARELADAVYDDDDLRHKTAEVLNKALQEAWPALVGLQRGNLREAMLEIRRQLKTQGKQLLLLVEDLSVSQGMDAELIESLQVSPGDGGRDLCALRSMVGVTTDDFNVMRENIAGRISIAVSFDLPFGSDEDGTITEKQLLDFASRYLNATRYNLTKLDNWNAGYQTGQELQSFCTSCPNITPCHGTFGEVAGRGLYPLSALTIPRLYRRLQGDGKAFNPRLLVSQVLNALLAEAEQAIPQKNFPNTRLLQWFKLTEVGAELQLSLNQKWGVEMGQRIRSALEIYSRDPYAGKLPGGVSDAFALNYTGVEVGKRKITESTSTTRPASPPPTRQQQIHDVFDVWLNQGKLSDADLNEWRKAVYGAIAGASDWDSDPLCPQFLNHFERRFIHFKGQRPTQLGDIQLVISPTPETASAMRGLVNGFDQDSRQSLLLMCDLVDSWAEDIRKQLQKLSRCTGQPKPLTVAVHVLTLGTLVRGILPEGIDEAQLLNAILTPWPTTTANPVGVQGARRSPSWQALISAFESKAAKLREWLLDEIACRKGGSTSAGMIDSAPILADLKIALSRVRVQLPEQAQEDWNSKVFGVVIDLARTILQHFDVAVRQESENCEKWLAKLTKATGNRSARELGERLKDTFQNVITEAVSVNAKASEIAQRCSTFIDGRVDEQMKVARSLATKGISSNQLLRGLGKLDQTIMLEAAEVITHAATELSAANQRLKRQLGNDKDNEPEELEKQLREKLADLRNNLESLILEAEND
jgi:hypothetical protein